jgi:hypothetical protein
MEFVLNGARMTLSPSQVERAVGTTEPEPLRDHGVRIGGVAYPVKQAFALATALPRQDFTTQTAARHLSRLGFELIGKGPRAEMTGTGIDGAHLSPARQGWPWEGKVQEALIKYLTDAGWTVTSSADTASKSRGVDVLAEKGARRLGAEVKGWPSRQYSDPRRAGEVKPTHPTNQAGHWFAQALMKGLMLLDSQPGCESLVVLPDGHERYQDLAHRTRSGRAAADVHVVFVSPSGTARSDTWTA